MRLTEELKKSLTLRVDYTNMTDKYLGEKGVTKKEIESHKKIAQDAHAYVAQNRGKDGLFIGWTDLP